MLKIGAGVVVGLFSGHYVSGRAPGSRAGVFVSEVCEPRGSTENGMWSFALKCP